MLFFLDIVELFKFIEVNFNKLWDFLFICGDVYFCKCVGFLF